MSFALCPARPALGAQRASPNAEHRTPNAAPRWFSSFEPARREAAKAGKPILVDFAASWCGPCRKMEEETFSDSAVRGLLQRVVCVRLDVDRHPPQAEQYQVEGIPRLLLLPANGGRPLLDVQGFEEARQFAADLRSALGLKNDEPAAPGSPALAQVRQALEKGGYAALKAADPRAASAGLQQLVEQVGVFKEPELAPIAGLLHNAGDDAIPALIHALGHEHLAVRAGAYRTLQALLRERRIQAPLAFDPWAPAKARQEAARQWLRWWQTHSRGG